MVALGLPAIAFAPPSSNFAMGMVLGTLFGQTTLASAWTAFGPGPLTWRLPLSLAWVGLLMVAFTVNVAMDIGIPSGLVETVVVMGCCVLVQWFLVQMPLWGLAMWSGLRLRHFDESAPAARDEQLGIRQFMILTAFVAAVFGIGRVVVSRMGDSFQPGHGIAIFVFLSVAGIVITLPLLIASLLPKFAVPATVLVFALIAVATAFELPLATASSVDINAEPEDFISINLATSAWIVAVAVAVRLNGYCLTSAGSRVHP
jgi:hypothetical protein